MEHTKRILVVSQSTKHCQKAVQYGISLARRYGAELFVMHVIHNPFGLDGWPVAIPSLVTLEEEYKRMVDQSKADLSKIIKAERTQGLSIKEMIREGDPTEEILRVVREEKIDLMIVLAHEEGRLEHLLFCRGMEELIRKMPCSILLVKQELPRGATWD